MPDQIQSRLTILTLCATALISWYSSTATAAGERWFRVELMVFKHQPGDYSETFAATPGLVYPDEFRFLVDPTQVALNTQQHEGRSQVNAYGRQIIEPEIIDEVDSSPAAIDAEPVVAQENTTLPLAFQLSRDGAREFRGKAAYMQRSGRYQILFHQTWIQPVVSERAALPIIIDRSGDEDAWPELQGHIKLYLSRYLHLETKLWLNTQGEYLGNDSWRMPAPPRAPASLIVETAPEETLPELTGGDTAPPAQPGDDQELALEDGADEDDIPAIAQYPWRHAVLLHQKRRMRSEEVHYIDHPLMGVLVRLLPIAEDDLEALNNAVSE